MKRPRRGRFRQGFLALRHGNPLDNIDLVADPDKNFALIMKDGKIYKYTVK